MDARFTLEGRQVNPLTQDDLPTVAKALVSVIRGRGGAIVDHIHNVSVIHLTGPDFSIFLRGEDWVKILPTLVAGAVNPISPPFEMTTRESEQSDLANPGLYQRTLGDLRAIFTTHYPTSNT